jgi:chemotaxis signal transduction protein
MAHTGEVTDSPSPVMTFDVGGSWLAVRVEQVDRVAVAPQLWPVPLARPEHVGLFDSGQELLPVLRLRTTPETPTPTAGEQLVALLHVRGESVGLAIDRAGRVHDHWWLDETSTPPPGDLAAAGAAAAISSSFRFWLVNADRLFTYDGGVTGPALPRA